MAAVVVVVGVVCCASLITDIHFAQYYSRVGHFGGGWKLFSRIATRGEAIWVSKVYLTILRQIIMAKCVELSLCVFTNARVSLLIVTFQSPNNEANKTQSGRAVHNIRRHFCQANLLWPQMVISCCCCCKSPHRTTTQSCRQNRLLLLSLSLFSRTNLNPPPYTDTRMLTTEVIS